MELGAEKIKYYKKQWEQTVEECQTDNPKVFAVLSVYGDYQSIHAVRLVIQNIDQEIIYQRDYHLLTATPTRWIDAIIEEVSWLGKNVKLTIIDRPQDIEYCPNECGALSTVLDKNIAIYLSATDWGKNSIGTIYINPIQPSLAFIVAYKGEDIFHCSLHKCGNFLHFHSDNFEERVPILGNTSIRQQAIEIILKVISTWNPGVLLIGTGNHDDPILIEEIVLPEVWEES